ncbi:MAG: right-handed parallel beta-helix repeat-containing protein [Candidatus Krumholzibacteriota bacterium]|nr:right-handed parallel beta-helix repeat-containing protein [Candidatus Krumholzibacteriota bacterium]
MVIPETNRYFVLFAVLLILLMPSGGLNARIVHVAVNGSDSGDGSAENPYVSVQMAIDDTYENGYGLPGGDTIYVHEGTYLNEPRAGGYQLYGEPDAWTYLMGVPGEDNPVFAALPTAGFTALHSDWPALNHFVLKRLTFKKTNPTEGAHNINIYSDDWDEEAVHHVVIDSCIFYNQRVNSEMIKMAGVDNFVIRNCYANGSNATSIAFAGVGCHNGEVVSCRIDSCMQGGIQFKGGSSEIVIRNNVINMASFTGVNMGGDTGTDHLRPSIDEMEEPTYEAKGIDVYSNVLIDCVVPFAFNTARDCRFYNNMVITTDLTRNAEGLYESVGVVWIRHTSDWCPNASRNCLVANNIFYFNEVRNGYQNIFFQLTSDNNYDEDDYASTFRFHNNLWYCYENPAESWKDWTNEGRWECVDTTGTNLYAVDPVLYTDPVSGLPLPSNSYTLAWKGISVTPPDGYEFRDFFGEVYSSPPPIGPVNLTSEPGAPPSMPSNRILMFQNLTGKKD